MNPLSESSLNRIVNVPPPDKEMQPQPSSRKIPRKSLLIHDFLKVSHSVISFGDVIPGNILESNFEVTNTTTNILVAQIMVVCQNREYDDLEEFVYSIRRSTSYDYNDKILLAI